MKTSYQVLAYGFGGHICWRETHLNEESAVESAKAYRKSNKSASVIVIDKFGCRVW